MPTYDYECTKCGYVFEVFHKVNFVSTKKCPQCNGKTKKLIGGGSGLIFKGSGFYITDYKRKPSKEDGSSKGKEKVLETNQSKSQPTQKKDDSKQKESA